MSTATTSPALLEPAPFDVYRLDQLAVRGWDRPAVDRAVRGGRARRVRRGVYALGPSPADEPTRHLQDVAGALLVIGPDAVASHRSGATLRRLPLLGRLGDVALTVPRATHRAYDDLSVHVGAITAQDRVVCRGLPATSVGRTLVDVARTGGKRAALVIADGALHQVLSDEAATAVLVTDWDRALEQARGWPGIVDARWARERADGRAESPLESLLRIVWEELGLPDIEPQVWITIGTVRYRVDAVVKRTRVVIECDGKIKYRVEPLDGVTSLEERVWDDRERDWLLAEAGWIVVHLTWEQIVHHPKVVQRKVVAALARAARLAP